MFWENIYKPLGFGDPICRQTPLVAGGRGGLFGGWAGGKKEHIMILVGFYQILSFLLCDFLLVVATVHLKKEDRNQRLESQDKLNGL